MSEKKPDDMLQSRDNLAVYYDIKTHAQQSYYYNTMIALELVFKYHEDEKRDDGSLYLLHPLMVAKTLILLRMEDELKKWFPLKKDEEIQKQCDILYASALLHDVLEECSISATNLKNEGIDDSVIEVIKLLTKKRKGSTNKVQIDEYFQNIQVNWIAALIKIADRENNCSTMQVFERSRMERYVAETKERFYPLFQNVKTRFPQCTDVVEIMKNSIVAEVDAVVALMMGHVESGENPIKLTEEQLAETEKDCIWTINFIKSYSKNKMPNTYKAIQIAEQLHSGQKRIIGDPFIIHPMRVCTYLMSLGIRDDILCAAMLLHEVPKKCNVAEEGWDLLEQYDLDRKVFDIIYKVPKNNQISLKNYYEMLSKDWRTILGRLANRAHTCTKLANLTEEEKKAYISETKKYLIPMCELAQGKYPEYSNVIEIMKKHIVTICTIVERWK